VINLTTGARVLVGAEDPFGTSSTIKSAILYTLLRRLDAIARPAAVRPRPVRSQSADFIHVAPEVVIRAAPKRENRAGARFLKPSSGLEPETPSLPFEVRCLSRLEQALERRLLGPE
jgi:hypothetical protein